VTYLIEYLGEFEFIFETVLGYVSGDQMGSFEAKKTESKISCLGTFKIPVISELEQLFALRLFCPAHLIPITPRRPAGHKIILNLGNDFYRTCRLFFMNTFVKMF
jgi:hypothetical protein